MTAFVRTTPQADAQATAAADWWYEHRPAAPDLFWRELEEAFLLLSQSPGVGGRYSVDGVPGLRRLYLQRTRHHVYYVHDEVVQEVVILAVWGATRGTPPHSMGRRKERLPEIEDE